MFVRIELRKALISYQDYHVLLLTLAGSLGEVSKKHTCPGLENVRVYVLL